MSPEQYEDFQNATQEDLELQTLQAVVMSGWPDTKDNISKYTNLYWPLRDEITCLDYMVNCSNDKKS